MAHLVDILKGEPLSVTIRRIREGLLAPKDSGEYKYARFAVTRIIGPPGVSFAASLALVLLAMLMSTEGRQAPQDNGFTITRADPTTVDQKELDTPEKPPEPAQPIDTPTPDSSDLEPGASSTAPAIADSNPYSHISEKNTEPGVNGDLDVPMDPFVPTLSQGPIVMIGVYSTRRKDGITTAIGNYCPGPGPGGNGKGHNPNIGKTIESVNLALRWLKKYQEADGSWKHTSGGDKAGSTVGTPAFTGLALLAYLANGETPSSQEFGPTVEKAIRWLVDNQLEDGRFKESDGNQYSLPIAAYALSEAYGMTKLPTVQLAAEKSIALIIKGQHETGGWDYNVKDDKRNDTSYMAWCSQALKAAHMAGLSNDKEISGAMKKSLEGFKVNYGKSDASGYAGFGYDGPGTTPLTGAGTLCMQMLGGIREKECKSGLQWLQQATFDWEKWAPATPRPLYHWYYITQARFHGGGEIWLSWHKQYFPVLMKTQVVLHKAGADGKDIGYWDSPSKEENYGRVYSTALCCLMVETPFRYLPMFKTPAADVAAISEAAAPVAMLGRVQEQPKVEQL